MKLKRVACAFLAALIFGAASPPAKAAKRYAPEIKEYLDQVKKRKKKEKEEERKKKRQDPNRRLRPYLTLEEIYEKLDEMCESHPDMLSCGTYGKSVEGRELRWVKLATEVPGDKPEILVSGNIHAQELAGGMMALGLLETLVNDYQDNCEVKRIADSAVIYFIPVLNPDGMAEAAKKQARFGVVGFRRKNKRKVDLNRNFPYPPEAPEKLKDSAGSPKKRSQTHRGPHPLSEPETKALDRFIASRNFFLSLNYHTWGGLIMFVPGTFPDPEPDTELMKELALVYQEKQFDKYTVEPEIDLYPTIGALDDYIYHRYGILAITVEVGKHNLQQIYTPINGTVSPVFWMYNVKELEREKANNIPAALALIKKAVEVYHEPGRVKWTPPEEKWVGEPEPETRVSEVRKHSPHLERDSHVRACSCN